MMTLSCLVRAKCYNSLMLFGLSFLHDLKSRALGNLLLLFVYFLFAGTAICQEIDEEGNWFKEIGKGDDYYTRFDFRRYTKEDVIEARDRYLKIASTPPLDPWAGSYYRQTMLGGSQIMWNPQDGFVYTYIYHMLRSVDYGRVIDSVDSVQFISERLNKGHSSVQIGYIRVKLGARHMLVPKDRLTDFAVWAAGREVPTGRRAKEISSEEGFFWEKVEDANKPIADVPTFPLSYAHLTRKPITTKVRSISGLRVTTEKSMDGTFTSKNHLRTVSLAGGRTNGIKVGMRFWIDDLEEWVEIVSVSSRTSKALLERPFIDDQECCSNYERGKISEFPCREPKPGMAARTRNDYF